MLFHPQKDLFHNDAHQALRALFSEKRKKLGMTEDALATKMKCSISFINEIESGSGAIAFPDIERLCDSLIISLTEMEAIFKPNSFFR
jgi:transcriptional regulator with XRE-family HTH domain